MPLPPPAPRKHLHTRRIQLDGYQREDGLWDIEAHLVDTKSYPFDNRFRGPIEPGVPVHEMWMRITVDDEMTLREVAASTDFSPFPSCPNAATVYERLVGLRIGPGWTERVKERIGTTEGCTHLFELLRPLATAAFQTLAPLRKRKPDPERRPMLLDTCHGWRAEGEAVAAIYPRWHRSDEAD